MASWGKWLREGRVYISWDDKSDALWTRILQRVPTFQQAAERERYMRRLGPDNDPISDYEDT